MRNDRGLRPVDCRQDRGGGALNALERLPEGGSIAAIEMDVIARGLGDVQADHVGDDMRDGFSLSLCPSSNAAASVSRAAVVSVLSSSAVMVSSSAGLFGVPSQ